MHEPKVGLDSQCFSYLLDAIAGIKEPTDQLAQERKALVRAWLYMPGTFYLSETVVAECAKIRHVDRRELHEGFKQTLFLNLPIQDRIAIESRTTYLLRFHPKQNDCRVLAEAEDLGLDTLLTYDRDFRHRLAPESIAVEVTTPGEYWARLDITKGISPKTIPHETNPLSKQSWWRW